MSGPRGCTGAYRAQQRLVSRAHLRRASCAPSCRRRLARRCRPACPRCGTRPRWGRAKRRLQPPWSASGTPTRSPVASFADDLDASLAHLLVPMRCRLEAKRCRAAVIRRLLDEKSTMKLVLAVLIQA